MKLRVNLTKSKIKNNIITNVLIKDNILYSTDAKTFISMPVEHENGVFETKLLKDDIFIPSGHSESDFPLPEFDFCEKLLFTKEDVEKFSACYKYAETFSLDFRDNLIIRGNDIFVTDGHYLITGKLSFSLPADEIIILNYVEQVDQIMKEKKDDDPLEIYCDKISHRISFRRGQVEVNVEYQTEAKVPSKETIESLMNQGKGNTYFLLPDKKLIDLSIKVGYVTKIDHTGQISACIDTVRTNLVPITKVPVHIDSKELEELGEHLPFFIDASFMKIASELGVLRLSFHYASEKGRIAYHGTGQNGLSIVIMALARED